MWHFHKSPDYWIFVNKWMLFVWIVDIYDLYDLFEEKRGTVDLATSKSSHNYSEKFRAVGNATNSLSKLQWA